MVLRMNYVRLTRWERFKAFFKKVFWFWKGQYLEVQLQDKTSPTRTDAEHAVARVVMETDIAPDCVSAMVFQGGCAIKVKHQDAWEMFLHNSYNEAADKAIEWLLLQGDEISTRGVSKLTRQQRLDFNAGRKHKRKLDIARKSNQHKPKSRQRH